MKPQAQIMLKGLKTTEEKQLFIQKYYEKFWWEVINDGLLYIQTKTGEVIKLYPNETQKKLLKLVVELWKANKPIRILIPKARQLGVSTLIEAIIISITCFIGKKKALIIADEGKKSTNIFNMSKLMYDKMSEVVKPIKKESNAKVLAFEGKDSRIDIDTAENKDAGRSGNWQIAHLSEVDYFRDAEYLMSGLSSCIAKLPQTMVFMESTGNGVGSYFHTMIQKSERGENDYITFFIPWFDNPEYSTPLLKDEKLELSREGKYGDELYYYETYNLTLEQMKWRRSSIRNEFNYNLRKQMQEFPSTISESFIASGQPVFRRELLELISKDYTREHDITAMVVEDEFTETDNGYIKIWNKPKFGMKYRYAIFADTGGLWYDNDKNCADYSCACVYDRIERKVVSTVHGHFESLHYAKILVAMAKHYDNAKLAIEINKYVSETDEQGISVLDNIREKVKYSNFYTREVYDDVIKRNTTKIGFHTNRETKQIMINRLTAYVNNYKEEDIYINDSDIIKEMMTYVINQTKTGKTTWNAQDGYKDDFVIALSGVLVVSDQMPIPVRVDRYDMDYDELITGDAVDAFS